jgi:hypothetical protein
VTDPREVSLLPNLGERITQGDVIASVIMMAVGVVVTTRMNSALDRMINRLDGAFGTKGHAGHSTCR